jgi:hypothetical protein
MDKKQESVEQKTEGVIPLAKARELMETAAEKVANRIMAAFGLEDKAKELSPEAEAAVEALPVADKVKASIKKDIVKLESEVQSLWVKAFALKLEQGNLHTEITASTREDVAKAFASAFVKADRWDSPYPEPERDRNLDKPFRQEQQTIADQPEKLAAMLVELDQKLKAGGPESPEYLGLLKEALMLKPDKILQSVHAQYLTNDQKEFAERAVRASTHKEEAMASEVKVTAEVKQNSKGGEVPGFQSGESASSGAKGAVPSVPGRVITEDKLPIDVLPKAEKGGEHLKTDYESEAASFDKEVEALKRGKGQVTEKAKLASVISEIRSLASSDDGLKLVESFVAYAKKKAKKVS